MAKTKTSFSCQNCGSSFAKWQGQCNSCKAWNTIVEEVISTQVPAAWEQSAGSAARVAQPLPIEEIATSDTPRKSTHDTELDRVLGGGLVPGSLTLLGGEPGIGKSTLMLQVGLRWPYKTLYVSGEESAQQIKMRADRLGKNQGQCLILTETQTQNILHHAVEQQPEVVIIDSIQTLQSNQIDSGSGSISQIRTATAELIKYAKSTQTPVVLIGHITKDGHIAGPKILEHMVDTVLQFEGDRHHVYRILRAHKNRFGSTNELGIYEMLSEGLRAVTNPSELLISKTDEPLSGTAIAATLEGMRPLMIEIQALVSSAVYGTPQRSATGYNLKRLNMILAVLEKRVGFKLGAKDVFLNITGGIQVDDPALDLAVVAAVLSSNNDMPLMRTCCFAGEIGLAGEVRPISRLDQRLSEAEKLGFTQIIVAKNSKIPKNTKINVIQVGKVHDLVQHLFV
ncbi:DNA repair protein RadA [Flavobacteriaceae bacterium]|nr:DNA repair protein RadA [Flavobacteriaceae bacterium]